MQLNNITYLWGYILTLFVRSFGSLQGTCLRPSDVVQVVRRAMDDWSVTPQGGKRTTKTTQRGKPRFSSQTQTKNFFMESKANFGNSEINASAYGRGAYTNLHPQTHKKSKPNPKPIKANFRNGKSPTGQK